MTRMKLEVRRSFSDRWFKNAKETFVDQEFGIKTLYEPSNAEIDIVFVHGITGHRERTWTAPDGDGPWPRTMLPSVLPEARVLTFGYDASVIGRWSSVSANRIGDHSRNLLSSLATHRALGDSDHRPIIFVAHSLGGLVVKDALLASRTSPEGHLRLILECVRGILFLATPHSGVDLAVVAERCARIAGLTGARTNRNIVQVLRPRSEVLERIQNNFHELLRSRLCDNDAQPISITCFYEELPMPGVGLVVPKNSAILPGYTAIGVHHDHRDIARYSDPCDPGVVSILGELRRWASAFASPSHTTNEFDKEVDCGDGDSQATDELTLDKEGGSGDRGSPAAADIYNSGFREVVGISIWGNVVNSNVVSGTQTIKGDLVFGR